MPQTLQGQAHVANVQGVIGAQTKSEISNAATDRLLKRFKSWEKVATAALDELQAELTTQTYPGVAAERLKASLSAIVASRGKVDLSHLGEMKTHEAMNWLEQLPGGGGKIAPFLSCYKLLQLVTTCYNLLQLCTTLYNFVQLCTTC